MSAVLDLLNIYDEVSVNVKNPYGISDVFIQNYIVRITVLGDERYMKTQESNSEIIFTPDGYIYIPSGGEVNDIEKAFADNYRINANTALYKLGFCESAGGTDNPELQFLYQVSSGFISAVSSDYSVQLTKHAAVSPDDEVCERLLSHLPFALGSENVTSEWLARVWEQLGLLFNERLAEYNGTVGEYINSHKTSQNVMGRVYFHLVENKDGKYPFAFLATYCNIHNNRSVQQTLGSALRQYKGKTEEIMKLLPTVLRAAEKSDFISEIVESGDIFSPIGLTSDEAYRFLCEIPLYNECGILCRIPDWWRKHTHRAGISVTADTKTSSKVGMDALMSFDVSLMLNGEVLTEDEISTLLSSSGGLAFIKGKWVEADKQRINETLEAYKAAREKFGSRDFSLSEVMRMQLGIGDISYQADDNSDTAIVSNNDWLKTLYSQIKALPDIKAVSVGSDFKATLRPYQLRGYRWLYGMKRLGFGACLSDDMGLGKTVQIIALLDIMRENKRGMSLVIIPASLIENWIIELKRFAPSLRYRVLHKSYGNTEIANDDGVDLYITTYAMAAKCEELRNYNWEAVIIDEAQAIKNPGTKQTKAVKLIPAGFKVAMTGTPVENRLTDLWSIFDFLNPGMLGTAKEFSDFTKRLRNRGNYSQLKQVVNPFILRRLKTDKSIISDLPDKLEMKNYPRLTKKQIVLYQSVVSDIQEKLDNTEGIERKGLVLASIIKFKQICNHPDQYTGQGLYSASESGKFELLAELCETVSAKKERMLVFTQFREMCAPLDEFLNGIFGKKGLVIHGGTAVKKRGSAVERFNSRDEYIPYMVLSLKAGGVGLNLTGANHVVHFDRWWNPAVENQATDRAFRIGQTKNVLVHKLITKGTIEEKIDAMIEDKNKLSGEILADTGESWITELPTDKLMSLFRLEV